MSMWVLLGETEIWISGLLECTALPNVSRHQPICWGPRENENRHRDRIQPLLASLTRPIRLLLPMDYDVHSCLPWSSGLGTTPGVGLLSLHHLMSQFLRISHLNRTGYRHKSSVGSVSLKNPEWFNRSCQQSVSEPNNMSTNHHSRSDIFKDFISSKREPDVSLSL